MFRENSDMKVSALRSGLLATLKENREKHISDFNDAYVGWLEAVREELSTNLDQVCKAIDNKSTNVRNVDVSRRAHQRPESHQREYDRAIQMLELHVVDTLDISADDVQKYVMDEWDWSDTFNASTTLYNKQP